MLFELKKQAKKMRVEALKKTTNELFMEIYRQNKSPYQIEKELGFCLPSIQESYSLDLLTKMAVVLNKQIEINIK